MAFIPAEQCVRAFVAFTFNGVPSKGYVLHFRKTGLGAVTLSDLERLGEEMSTWLGAQLADASSTSLTFNYIQLRALDSATAPYHEVTFPDGIPGTLTGDACTSNVCIAVHKGTAVGGKSGSGRVFHTGIQKSAVSGNAISGTLATLIQSVWAELGEYTSPVGFLPCIVSYQTGGAPRPAGIPYTITSWTLRDRRVDTQRRRLS